MQQATGARRILRFGVFEVDLSSGELRRDGLKLRIQEQPFQVLRLLLERPGDVVTREALREELWPEGTFVDFEHSLNTAVKKLRDALGDDADNPRFVETLPPLRGTRETAVAMIRNRHRLPKLPTRLPGRAARPRRSSV